MSEDEECEEYCDEDDEDFIDVQNESAELSEGVDKYENDDEDSKPNKKIRLDDTKQGSFYLKKTCR